MDKLVPFAPHAGSFAVLGFFSFAKGRLHLKFEVRDPAMEIVGGLVNGVHVGAACARADELWKATCLEAFFGEPGKPGYYEVNFAPDGSRWNLYKFSDYRLPQPPARSEDFALDRVTVRDGTLDAVLHTTLPLGPLEASVCAVIKRASDTQYYAFSHAGGKPDFHLRASFCAGASK
jgi:hypothetical protein